jgi:hypothetical protein
MIDWKNMSNAEIRMKIASMEQEYDAIKMKINNLITELDNIDVEYNNANKELNKRSK